MEYFKITNLENFEISKSGIIRNCSNLKIKSQYIGSTGYYMISVSKNNKSKPYRVHRLLAETFIPKKDGCLFVNHIDGNKLNNSLENLEWCTQSENIKHAITTGLKISSKGEKNGASKLKESDIFEIRKSDLSSRNLGLIYGVDKSIILDVKNLKTWKHI